MLFRILPVMVWSLTGSLIGTATAIFDGYEINWLAYLLVLKISALVQGYPTHIINEIFDWKSGADSHELRAEKSGGSKVLQSKLLKMNDLWKAFVISHVVLFALIAVCVSVIDYKIVLYFILPGYLSGLLYSLPPFRFAYRPFLGEWLGAFLGMFFLISGSYYAQSFSMSLSAVLVASGVGLIYIGIMIFFHYLDFEYDKVAVPVKNTTVVYLGLSACRNYAYFCLMLSIPLFLISVLKFHIEGLILLLLSCTVVLSHNRADLRNAFSIIKWGKVITLATLVIGICFASMAHPVFTLMTIPVIIGFWTHKKFGKLKRFNIPASS